MHGGAAQGFPVAEATGSQPHRPQVPALAEGDADEGVLGRFRHVVTLAPEAVAVSDGNDRLSFDELARRAASVRTAVGAAMARLPGPVLRATEGAPGGPDPVAVLCEHDAAAVGAVIGVLASGHPLLVLDPQAPQDRLRSLVDRAGARVVVCAPTTQDSAAGLAGELVVVGRDTPEAPSQHLWEQLPQAGLVATLEPAERLTGGPALIAVDHRALVLQAYSRSVLTGGIRDGDRLAQPLPLPASAGLLGTLTALLAGAEVCLYDVRTRGTEGLADWIQAEGPSVLAVDPPLLRSMLRSWPWQEQFVSVRSVVICGDTAYAREVGLLRALLTPSGLVHRWYATGEGGLLADHTLPADGPALDGVLPAGRPGYDRELLVVDEQGRPVPDGQTGQVVATCRTHLFSGYWLDPEATAAVVTANPDGSRRFLTGDLGRIDTDGVLHVAGRHEHTVRIGGQAVDPAQIDAVLFGLAEVREAVVVGADVDGVTGDGHRAAAPAGAGPDQRLVAYVVPDADQPSAARLRAALRAALPSHLVPETVVYLDVLPRTTAGLVDRTQLPPPPPRPAVAAGEVPETRWEEMIAEIWAEVLELDRIGRHEDFFELGGDSLSAEALISRIIAELGADEQVCTTGLLIQAPTVAEFAVRLRGRPSIRRGPLVPLNPAGRRPPLFIVAGGGGLGIAFVPWARLLGPDQPTWALQNPALEGRGLPERSVPSIARAHVAAIRGVQPRGPYFLAGHSFGGLLALEVAQQLHAAGEHVGLLAIIDSFPPDPASQPPLPRRAPVQKVRDLAGVTLMSVLPTPGGRDHWRFQFHGARMAHRYTCPPWGGRTLVLVADTVEKQLRSQWAPHLTGTWRLAEIPGDHLSITRLPWAAAVADELKAELDAVHAGR
ncbi:MAG TPA: AMP-binding protein [Kineosporiaceae bacterium]